MACCWTWFIFHDCLYYAAIKYWYGTIPSKWVNQHPLESLPTSTPDVLRFWDYVSLWNKRAKPLISQPKKTRGNSHLQQRDCLEKEMRFLPLSPFNLGANISLSTMAQWLANYNEPANLHWWKYYKRLCIFKTHKHDWHQIQSAEQRSRDPHVVFWHLKNAFGSVALHMKTLSSNKHQNLVKAFFTGHSNVFQCCNLSQHCIHWK